MPLARPIRRKNHGRGHSYYDANGVKVTGVTSVLQKGIPKPALVKWAAGCAATCAVDEWDELSAMPVMDRYNRLVDAPNRDRDTAGVQGTAVHRLAVPLVAGKEVKVPQKLRGYVESYARFLDDYKVEPVLTEFTVVSYEPDSEYAGTGDQIADLRVTDGIRQAWPEFGDVDLFTLLYDIKTGRKGIFGETALQLAAYRYAGFYVDENGEEQPMPTVDATAAVWLRDNGYDLVPVEAGPRQHRQFLYAMQVARFSAESRDLVGDPVPHPMPDEVAE